MIAWTCRACAQAGLAEVTVGDRGLSISGATFDRFAAAGDDEAGGGVGGGDGIAEGVEGGCGGRCDLRAHVGAGDGVVAERKQSPLAEHGSVGLVEGAEAGIVERRRGTQLAGAESGQRAADGLEIAGDAGETLGERHQVRKARTLDPIARQRGDAGGILEHAADEAIAAGCEGDGLSQVESPVPRPRCYTIAATMPGDRTAC